jgi:4-alpha-glucanotransferase
MILSPEKRIAGVLAPLFALRTETDLGIGDLDALRQFIDWSARVGFKLVQLLPINETGQDNSPYNAISAMAIESTTLHLAPGSPEDLSGVDYEAAVAKAGVEKLRQGPVRYRRVKKLKRHLLEKAFARFRERTASDGNAANEFHAFCHAEKSWLDDYVFFRAIMERNGDREAWDRWREEHRTLQAARSWFEALGLKRRAKVTERQDFFRYVQWVARSQWRAIRAHAEVRGVALKGDIPFGVSYYSADVFSRPGEFALEWSGGAPPEPYFKEDEFTQKWGQNWGIPLYRWDAMERNDFAWWRQRIRWVRKIFHVFRIDHVLGFYRIYAFPWRPQRNEEFLPLDWNQMQQRTGGLVPHFAPRDDETRENCEANRREGEKYLRVVIEEAGDTRVTGEDLGTVPDYVRPSLRSLGIAGFKIPQWENYPDHRSIPGSEYERLAVATFATHDHKPIRALWDEVFARPSETSTQARRDLEKIAEFAGWKPSPNERFDYARGFYPAILEALFRSDAWIAVVMITDLLLRKDRFNVPGTAKSSNWSRRMHLTVAQLAESPTVRKQMNVFRKLLEKTDRAEARLSS